MEKDMVKNPAHYTEGRKYQPKDVIRDWGLGFCLGNALKYIARAGRKDDIVQDLKKAQEYLQFEIDAIEEERDKKSLPRHLDCRCSTVPTSYFKEVQSHEIESFEHFYNGGFELKKSFQVPEMIPVRGCKIVVEFPFDADINGVCNKVVREIRRAANENR